MGPRSALALALLVSGCSGRGCGHSSAPDGSRAVSAAASEPPTISPARCHREIANAAVATPPGMGAIDALVPTCGPGDAITVWAMRGHTLSRFARPRAAGGVFGPPEVVATGADRLGPIGPDDALGPAAWRSPTAALEGLESDEWWAAYLAPDADAGARVRRGSVLMPENAVGLGIVAPLARTAAGLEVLGTVSRTGENPRLVRHVIAAPRDEVETLGVLPAALAEGELKAFEPAQRVALVYAVNPGGSGLLRALGITPDAARARGEVALSRQHVLAAARGVARGDATLFAYSEFDVVRRESGPCLALDDSLCVAPGPVTLLRVDARGVRGITVAPAGLVDTLALDERDRVLVFYLAQDGAERGQRAARIDPDTGAVEPIELVLSDDLPPLDHPALVRCGREPWLAAEVVLSEGVDSGTARPESAVIALPVGCLIGRSPRAPGRR